MTCEHPGCSFDVFSSCINHCTKNLCLEHSMEHGDIFLKDFTKLLDNLDQSTRTLMSEANDAVKQVSLKMEENFYNSSINRSLAMNFYKGIG